MVLIDTSVLINYLKNIENEYTNTLNILLENKYPVGINNFIYQEVLQGAKSQREYEIMLLTCDSDFKNLSILLINYRDCGSA